MQKILDTKISFQSHEVPESLVAEKVCGISLSNPVNIIRSCIED